MRIILHAGSNKTGSTAIQSSFDASRRKLLKAGILYPKTAADTHHSKLIMAILDDEEFRGNLNRSSAEGRKQGVEASERLWKSLYRQVRRTKPEVLLLSSEFIFGLRPHSLERFVKRLEVMSDEIYSIVYLRNPVDHYLSSAQQILKYGAKVKDPYVAQNYTNTLRKLNSIVPRGVECRLFSRASLFRNDVTLDLLSYVMPPEKMQAIDIQPIESNVSFSAEAMALLQDFNDVVWGERRIVGHSLNKTILKSIEAIEREQPFTKAVLRPQIREIVEGVHLADMRELRDEFGIVFDRFDYDLEPSDAAQDRFADQALTVSDIVDYDPELLRMLTIRVMARLARAAGTEKSSVLRRALQRLRA